MANLKCHNLMDVLSPDANVTSTALTIKQTRCTNFSNLFWNEILHVLDSSSVHHLEFSTVHTAMVYVTQVRKQLAIRNRMELNVKVYSPIHFLAMCYATSSVIQQAPTGHYKFTESLKVNKLEQTPSNCKPKSTSKHFTCAT
jgi:hypothetical protein